MAKRFTDTEIWEKEWYMSLSSKHKLLIRFLFDKCDASGVWSPNWVLATAYIGEKVCAEDLNFFGERVEFLRNGKVFICDFVLFQYGELSEKCPPHKKIIALLKNHGIFERVTKGIAYPNVRVQEKEEEEDKDKEEETVKEKDKEEEKERKPRAKKNEHLQVEIVYPFNTDSFMQIWGHWKQYKLDQFSFRYKPIGEQAVLQELARLASGSEEKAMEIIKQSMAHGWKGFFELKTTNNGQSANNTQPNFQSAFAKLDAMYSPDRK